MPESISVVVCTYNRAAGLAVTLDGLAAAAQAAGTAVELVVVDNNSADDTPAVIEAFRRDAPVTVRPVHERRQGLAMARNAGVAAATGDVVAFTDDDVTVEPDWLLRLGEAFDRTGAAAAGGPILPAWEGPVPAWLTPRLHRHFAVLDLGPAARKLDHADVWGANFAVRRAMFGLYGDFPTHLGHCGAALGAGEESAFLMRLVGGGEALWYWPACRVHHRIPKSRMTRRYVLRHEWSRGRQEGRADAAELGLPAWLARVVVQSGIAAVVESGIAAALPGAAAMEKRIRFAYWLGYAGGVLAARRDAVTALSRAG